MLMAKLAVIEMSRSYRQQYGFDCISAIPANVFGPGQQLYRIIPRTILYARLGKKLLLHGGGLSKRSFIHMNDVSDATYRVALNGIVGDTYHISTENIISIRKLVMKICKIMQVKFSDLVEESDERLGKDQSYMLDSSKLRKEQKWEDIIKIFAIV